MREKKLSVSLFYEKSGMGRVDLSEMNAVMLVKWLFIYLNEMGFGGRE